MQKDFDRWNIKKKRIEDASPTHAFAASRRWVWMCALGVNVGFEEDGSMAQFERPVLIVAKINNQMYWVVPLSSKQRAFDFCYNFTDPNGHAVSALVAQMRLISAKRLQRRMYKMPAKEFDTIVDRLRGYLKKSEPRTGRGSSESPEGNAV